MPKSAAKRPGTAKLGRVDVVLLVGDVEDSLVTAILATGASYAEIEEAVKWAEGNADALGRAGRTLSPAAEAVYDLLAADPTFLGPKRER